MLQMAQCQASRSRAVLGNYQSDCGSTAWSQLVSADAAESVSMGLNLVYATHEERIPMVGTKQSELRVLDGVRTGGLPRVMTDRS